jgi:hypothetical protein
MQPYFDMILKSLPYKFIHPLTLAFLFLLLPVCNIKADENSDWKFGFGFGALFPDASELIDPNSPNGLNISASMVHQYQSWLMMQGTINFDYFSNDKQLNFRSYIILFNFTLEGRIHPLSVSSKFSPYLMGGVAPAVYLNTKPYIEEGQDLDPFSTRRNYDLNVGYTLKYGIGISIYLSDQMHLWTEWQYSRFDFFKGSEPLRYRAFLIGMLLDVQWL